MKLGNPLPAMRANILRYSMPGAGSYDRAANLFFRGRYREIAAAIARETPPGSAVLDVACGPGEVLVRLARLAPGLRLTGLDVDEPMIRRAERKAAKQLPIPATRPRFVVADVSAMPFPDASFDVVVSSYAVHHWPDRHAGLTEMMRVLKPGGRAIIWDIAPPMSDDSDGPHGHGATPSLEHVPMPSLLHTLRMLILSRRLPSKRYDFEKPAA